MSDETAESLLARVAELEKLCEEKDREILELKTKLQSYENKEAAPKVESVATARISNDVFGGKPKHELMDVSCLTPRGKHKIMVYEDGLMLVDAKSNAIQINRKSISQVFVLSLPGANKQTICILELEQPFTVGKTSHSYITIQSKQSEICKVVGDTAVEPAPASVALSSLVSNIYGIGRITTNVVRGFRSSTGNGAVQCNAKDVRDGFLFPLDTHIVFVVNPLIVIPLKNVASAVVAKCDTRFCQVGIYQKDVAKPEVFTMIAFDEATSLQEYFRAKKIKTPEEVELKRCSSNPVSKTDSATKIASVGSIKNEKVEVVVVPDDAAAAAAAAANGDETEESSNSDDSDDNYDPGAIPSDDGSDDDEDDEDDVDVAEEHDDEDDDDDDDSDDDADRLLKKRKSKSSSTDVSEENETKKPKNP